MSDAMDERRQGFEEEYFHRKNKEAIEKLREKMKVSEEAKAAGTSSMKCPRCDGTLEGEQIRRSDDRYSATSVVACGSIPANSNN